MFFSKSIGLDTTELDAVERLNRMIRSHNRLLSRDPRHHKTWYIKAEELMKIFQLTGESSAIQDALNCYTEAVKLAPENPFYRIDRSTCYINLQKDDLAQIDLEKAKSLPKLDGMFSMCVENQIEKIEEYFNNKKLHPYSPQNNNPQYQQHNNNLQYQQYNNNPKY